RTGRPAPSPVRRSPGEPRASRGFALCGVRRSWEDGPRRATMTTTATRLFLVRHGATQLTAEDRFSGSAGVDLSDEGRQQADPRATRLSEEALSAVYASPLSRTLETAEILARPHGLRVEARDGLREI